jgi:hypothetical protein
MKEEHKERYMVPCNEWWKCPDLIAAKNLRMVPSFNPLSMGGVIGLVELTHELRNRLGPGPHKMAELGSWSGESAAIFAGSRLFNKLHCIDIWRQPEYEGLCEYRLRSFIHEGIVEMHHASMFQKVSDFEDGSLDFVYLDADHTLEETMQAIPLWLPKVRPGGCFGGHDYNEKCWPGVVEGVTRSFAGKTPALFMDTSWLFSIPLEA